MIVLVGHLFIQTAAGAFVHPGCLSTQADLDRMSAKVAANEQPWQGSWDRLTANWHAQLTYTPNPQTEVCAGGVCSPENYMTLANDCAAAYQCALRYHVSGNTAYADKAVEIMNAWASVFERFTGDSNAGLRAGLYGYQFACAGELMRNYSGWASADVAAFKNMMLTIFYPINSDFLIRHNGTCDSHYWANWDLAAMTSVLAISVLCDDQAKFDEAITYFYSGIGEGAIGNAVHTIHPDGTGQWQESGRDQGHNTLGMALMGPFCEIAWNQGVDLYSYAGNRFLAGSEYVTKYNLGSDVPYVTYINCEYVVQPVISSAGRGTIRPGWDMLYNHYVNRMGWTAPYTQQYAAKVRPEGGGGDYGSTSGGFDSLGFTTLTHTLDPITAGAVPGDLLPYVKGSQVTLSWRGSAYAESYNVKRSITSGGPYTTLATVAGDDNDYVDPGLTPAATYYYVVSANNPGGESANSDQAAATADGQLYGTIIGTDGSYNNAGAAKETVFDGSLKNFFDAPSSVAWAGLDLGDGVSAVVQQIKYCPRPGFGSRMVGGKFQGSNTADFSSGVTDLFTVTAQPADGVLASRIISNATSFRYLRYLCPSGGYGNVAEVQFLGTVSGLSAPAAPGGLSASVVNGYQIHLSWNAVADAASYNLKRATNAGGPYIIVKNVSDTSDEDKNCPGETTYYYVVSALNSAGESANSTEAQGSTQTSAPIQVAYYEFEGDVDDSSLNGYHATTAGSPLYVAGKVGQAIDLNGTDDFVTLPSGVADSGDMTIAAWVNWDGGDDWQRIFDFGNNTDQYLFLTPKSGGSNTLRFAIKNGGSEQLVETTQLAAGQWEYVAVTLAGDRATLYVNGLPVDTNNAVTINPGDFTPANNYIGDSQWTADPLFAGLIDDFRIYNYALSEAAVLRMAQQQMNMGDLSVLALWWLWLTKDCDPGSNCLDADLDGNGEINLSDFSELARHWLE